MTSYPGPWIQAPDYDRDGYEAVVSGSPYGDAIPYEAHVAADTDAPTAEFDPYTPGDLTGPIAAVESAALGLPTDVKEGFVRHEISYGIEGPPFLYNRSQDVWRSYRVAAMSPESLGLRFWEPTPAVGITPPADAIGWEWQDPAWAPDEVAKSEVRRLVAEIQYRPTTPDSSSSLYGPVLLQSWFTALEISSGRFVSDDGPVFTAEADWLTHWDGPTDNHDATHGGNPAILRVVDGPISADPDDPTGPALIDTIDLTDRLDDKGRIVIASSVSFQDGAASGIVTPWSPTGEDPFLMDDDTVEYGHGFNIVPHWTMRPPVFRWLYATPRITSAPPLRHTQRDDRHGPSPPQPTRTVTTSGTTEHRIPMTTLGGAPCH